MQTDPCRHCKDENELFEEIVTFSRSLFFFYKGYNSARNKLSQLLLSISEKSVQIKRFVGLRMTWPEAESVSDEVCLLFLNCTRYSSVWFGGAKRSSNALTSLS